MILKRTSNCSSLDDIRCILSEIQVILEKQPTLTPLDILSKMIRIIEHGDVNQLKRVEFWIFELVRGLYDTGFLRDFTDDECDTLFSKINSMQELLRKKMER